MKRWNQERIEKNFINEIINYGSKIFPAIDLETLKICIQCGKCTGGCPSGRRVAWNIRRLFRGVYLGLKEEVLSDERLWDCTTCYTCQERCPRNVKTTDFVRIIRNLAVRSGYMKQNHKQVCSLVLSYGHAVPINDDIKKIRKDLGLPEIPPTAYAYKNELDEVVRLMKETGFDKLIEG